MRSSAIRENFEAPSETDSSDTGGGERKYGFTEESVTEDISLFEPLSNDQKRLPEYCQG